MILEAKFGQHLPLNRQSETYAREGVEIDAIFDAERSINGLPAEQRLALRQKHVAPLVAELETWMRGARGKMSRHAEVGRAMDYMLKRWDTFSRFLGDGRICLSNNAAERADDCGLLHIAGAARDHRRLLCLWANRCEACPRSTVFSDKLSILLTA